MMNRVIVYAKDHDLCVLKQGDASAKYSGD